MKISAENLDYRILNEKIKATKEDVEIKDCYGQRYIGANQSDKTITIDGIPGNALGVYLDGATIEINGNVQDAVGDTMNDGRIIVHGDAGDALGYAMRGGEIFVKGGAGYRTGIHMKEYEGKKPVIIVGGSAGSFLGEYLAGGLIVVLGLGVDTQPVGNFPGTGMHGGKIFIRSDVKIEGLPKQSIIEDASEEDLLEIEPYIRDYAGYFDMNPDEILKARFQVLKPNKKNQYEQLYAAN